MSLTRDEARERARLLRVESYRIELDLTGAGDTFASTTTVRFTCAEPGASTFVETKAATVESVVLNGVAAPSRPEENRLALTGLLADNELVVTATMGYSNAGQGLHRFVDPADGETYLYSQCFLDDAQAIFACFDQPDLKAPLTLAVTASAAWTVVANAVLERCADGRWEFAATQPLSTYMLSLIAGPYHRASTVHDGVPMALYCRQSMAGFLEADEIFGITTAALDEYHRLFGIRYPFGKYDQVFVPEFNPGAMENPGLVTFRDEFLFRSAAAQTERETRAEVIAHEMAHMWFGDLVTMRWWDDLWLNESFAEYMGYRVTADVTRFSGAWTGFALVRKAWGYSADQRPSTHPVAPEPEAVPDGRAALLNFDGISYAKGAAALRQLQAWIGDEAFLAGIRDHLTAHAFSNATLADFLDALARHTDRDVRGWARVWLRRSGVNTLRPVRREDGLHIEQTGTPSRPHRLGVAVYSGGSRVFHRLVDVAGATTSVGEVPAGDLVLINDGDLTFAKVRLLADDLPAALARLGDPLARALVWASVADAVRDAEVSAWRLVDLFVGSAPVERDPAILNDVLRMIRSRAVDARHSVAGTVGRFLSGDQVAPAEAAVAAACQAVASGNLLATRGFLDTFDRPDVAVVRGWLAGGEAPVPLDVDLRWRALTRLATLGEAGTAEIEAELARDPTADGEQHSVRALAARPDPAAKASAWLTITRDTARSNRLVLAAAEGFWSARETEATHPYVARYFEEMPAVVGLRPAGVSEQVAAAAFPRFAASESTVEQAEALLARPDLDPGLRRVVADRTDELRRALAGQRVPR